MREEQVGDGKKHILYAALFVCELKDRARSVTLWNNRFHTTASTLPRLS